MGWGVSGDRIIEGEAISKNPPVRSGRVTDKNPGLMTKGDWMSDDRNRDGMDELRDLGGEEYGDTGGQSGGDGRARPPAGNGA